MIRRFGVFELDDATGELRRSGIRIRVQDQPLRILRELLDRRGEIVTREELRTKIWGDTFVDYDRALNTAVKKLRDALSDSAEAPRYVETVARRGYRFVAPVEEGAALALGVGRLGSTADQASHSERLKPKALMGVLAAVVAVALLAITLYASWPKTTLRSLAVLPFANLTGAAGNEYVADGVTDALISDLANIASLRVISRTSAMQYKNVRKPLPEIASALGVDGVVEGAVLRFGDRVRVEVKLIDAARDALLWSDQYERPASELDSLQRDVAGAVAAQLRTRLSDAQASRAPDAEAHLLTMKGRHWLTDKRDGKVAVQLFRQAIARDPTYAAPYAALAEAEMFAPEDDVSPYEALVRAKAAAEKAVALDPALADAHASLGLVHMFLDRDFAAAEREYRRAIELKPGAFEGHHRYGQLLAAQGRFEEALSEAKRATELDPFSTLALDDYGRTLYFARRHDEALVQYDRALAIEPDDQIALWFRVYALMAAKQDDRAIDEIAELLRISGRSEHVPRLRDLYRKQGLKALMKIWADLDAARFRERPFVRTTGIAARYAQAGETELALEWLERAYRSHTRDLVYLNVEPQLDPLRGDPRFAAIVKKAGLAPTSSSAPSAPASPRP